MNYNHPNIIIDIYNHLQEKGHTCMIVSKDTDKKSHLLWCEMDECEDAQYRTKINRINNEILTFGHELLEKGHTCVKYNDKKIPMQLMWCKNNDSCNNL